MIPEKWQLYSQTGPDGQEWGVKIRPGYIVIGFSREDAEAVVTWQNAAVSRPAGDVLERAKALQEQLYDEPDESVGGNPCRYRKQLFDLIPELIAEVEASRDKITQDAITIEMHHGNVLTLQKEVERLRNLPRADIAAYDRRIQEMAASIKELEAEQIWICGPGHHEFQKKDLQPGYKSLECPACGGVIRPKMSWLEDHAERLEAAFLDHLAARLYYEHYPGVSDAYSWHDYPEDACQMHPKEMFRQKAREKLEKIRSGKDDD